MHIYICVCNNQEICSCLLLLGDIIQKHTTLFLLQKFEKKKTFPFMSISVEIDMKF